MVQQSDIEAAQVLVTASASSPGLPLGAQVVPAQSWTVPVDVNPQLDVDIEADNCAQLNGTSEYSSMWGLGILGE